MIDCQKVANQLVEYLDKELDKNAISELEAHLDLCRQCFNLKEFETLLRDHLKKKTCHSCPDSVKSKIKSILDRF